MHDINKLIFVGAEPWHALGTRLPKNARFEELVELAGFYTAEERNLSIENSVEKVPDRKALVRADDGRYLSTVGVHYKVVQFADIARTMVAAAGMFGGFFVTASLSSVLLPVRWPPLGLAGA